MVVEGIEGAVVLEADRVDEVEGEVAKLRKMGGHTEIHDERIAKHGSGEAFTLIQFVMQASPKTRTYCRHRTAVGGT